MSWKHTKLGDICEFVRGPFGGSLKKEDFVPEGYAVYEQNHAIYDHFSKVRYFIDEDKFSKMKRFTLNEGDLIMSCSGTMGKVAIAPKGIEKGIINQALLKIRTSEVLDVDYLKLWMQSSSFQNSLANHTHGAAIKNVASVKILKEIRIPLPPLNEQKRIAMILDKADALRQKREKALVLTEDLLRATFLDMFGDPLSNPKNWKLGTFRDIAEINPKVLKMNDTDLVSFVPMKAVSTSTDLIDSR